MQDNRSRVQTIAAVATPPGRGGIGIVRVSGPECLTLAGRVFRSSRAGFRNPLPYRMHHGWVIDEQGSDLDEAMLCFMPGPGSFTGEDVLELHCHGNPAILQAVLSTLFRQGACPAAPGEFTARAFLNGRMDLSQAEAVAEMINATSMAGARLAGEKLKGGLGVRVRQLREHLEELRALLCLAVDFPEEETECLGREEFLRRLETVKEAIGGFLANAQRVSVWREGALVVIAGSVNAGKSSLLNALLGRERALVNACPGTTRDYLEEMIDLQGLPVRLVDTAGLRTAADEVERAGMEMARGLMQRAELILVVFDSAVSTAEEDLGWLAGYGREKLLGVANKVDLGPAADAEVPFARAGIKVVRVSAKYGDGIEELVKAIRERITGASGGEPEEGLLAPNVRQQAILGKALDEILELEKDILQEIPFDLLGVRLELACQTLSELTGEITSQGVLDGIFGRFCIGK
jgi:tRNA modification GTPase